MAGIGGVTIDDVRKDIFARDDLVVADRSDAVLARVTTAQAIEEERFLLAALRLRINRHVIACVIPQILAERDHFELSYANRLNRAMGLYCGLPP